jgi:hypothetical protein
VINSPANDSSIKCFNGIPLIAEESNGVTQFEASTSNGVANFTVAQHCLREVASGQTGEWAKQEEEPEEGVAGWEEMRQAFESASSGG